MALDMGAIQSVKDALAKADSIYVLLPRQVNLDSVASAIALYASLLETGKNVSIASAGSLPEQASQLPQSDLISDKIGNRNLVISIKVDSRDSIDKVSYNLDEEGKTFNLIIQPKKGRPALKSDDVGFSYAGAQADLVFIVGANRYEDLGRFYEDEKKLFAEAKTVAVNRFSANRYAEIHIDEVDTGSVSEVVYKLMPQLGLNVNDKIATNLLAGIHYSTANLQSPAVTADTFEAVAALLRAGGVRQMQATGSQTPSFQNSYPGTSYTRPAAPPPSPVPQAPSPTPATSDTGTPAAGNQVPDEWLTPKIYKSTPKV